MSDEAVVTFASVAAYLDEEENRDKINTNLSKDNNNNNNNNKQNKAKFPKNDKKLSIPNRKKQTDKEFLEHKEQVISNLESNSCDNSPKGGVDRNCLPLMKLLNEHSDYVTTSSCGGRIAIFHSVPISESFTNDNTKTIITENKDNSQIGVKRGTKDALGWLLVKHDLLTEQEIEIIVHSLCDDSENNEITPIKDVLSKKENKDDKGELDGVWVEKEGGVLNPQYLPNFGMVVLKMEPFVMHVECRTMESAKKLLSAAATDGGFRNSGVTPPGKKIMCAIRHASGLGLDVPLIIDGVNYVKGQHNYVRCLLQMANNKMIGNDIRVRRLKTGVATRLGIKEEEKEN